jgi:hypothetical protein
MGGMGGYGFRVERALGGGDRDGLEDCGLPLKLAAEGKKGWRFEGMGEGD